jgi:hypothetical protein
MTLKMMLRAACLIACAGLYACAATKEPVTAPPPAPAEAPPPAKPLPVIPAEAPAPPPAPPQAAPEPPPAPKAASKAAPKRKAPARKPAPPPVVKAPEPPPVVVPVISPEQERSRRLNDYIAALQKSVITFNPPSPMQVERRTAVQLSVSPPKEAAQLAEDLRKSLAAPEAWRPRLRAQLGGASFEIAQAQGKDSAGEKDLSAAGPTEWSWDVVPKLPGTKQLAVRVAILLPPGLGEARELPALQRDVTVEASLAWTLGNLWSDYWLWILAMLAVAVAALLWWRRQRSAAG